MENLIRYKSKTINGVRYTREHLNIINMDELRINLPRYIYSVHGSFDAFTRVCRLPYNHRGVIARFLKTSQGGDPLLIKILTNISTQDCSDYLNLDKREVINKLEFYVSGEYLKNPEPRAKVITITDRLIALDKKLESIESRISNIERFLIV